MQRNPARVPPGSSTQEKILAIETVMDYATLLHDGVKTDVIVPYKGKDMSLFEYIYCTDKDLRIDCAVGSGDHTKIARDAIVAYYFRHTSLTPMRIIGIIDDLLNADSDAVFTVWDASMSGVALYFARYVELNMERLAENHPLFLYHAVSTLGIPGLGTDAFKAIATTKSRVDIGHLAFSSLFATLATGGDAEDIAFKRQYVVDLFSENAKVTDLDFVFDRREFTEIHDTDVTKSIFMSGKSVTVHRKAYRKLVETTMDKEIDKVCLERVVSFAFEALMYGGLTPYQVCLCYHRMAGDFLEWGYTGNDKNPAGKSFMWIACKVRV